MRRQPLVLLVEDELASAEAITCLLQLNGFEVATAGNGVEALERLAGDRPDLLLSDLMMPVMDGAELVRRVRERPELAGLPIVLMSAAHHLLGEGLPVEAALPKPLDLTRLLATLRRLLRSA